ncbi:MAG: NepR family anti-sigma factor [Caulobacterales bacterium]
MLDDAGNKSESSMANEGGPGRPPKPERADERADNISRQLKMVYDEVADQQVPDKIMQLLGKLDEIKLPSPDEDKDGQGAVR